MIVSGGETYQIPTEGSVQGVLAEVVDLGNLEVTWKGESKIQHKCLLTFEITEENDKHERLIISQRFTASLNEKAALRKFLEGWRGRSFTADELKAFDLSKLVGVNAILSLSHNQSGDKTYCNIASAAMLLKGMEKIAVSENYLPYAERMAKRNAKAQAASAGGTEPPEPGSFEASDDDIPF